MSIGTAIRKRRLLLDLTQQALAERAGLTAAADVSKIESGKVWPPEQKLYAMAEALGCRVSDLFCDETPDVEDVDRAGPEKVISNEELLNLSLLLNSTVTEIHASHSRSMQIVFHSIAKQLDGSKLLTDIKSARDRVDSEPTENRMLKEILNHLIEQLMRTAGDRSAS